MRITNTTRQNECSSTTSVQDTGGEGEGSGHLKSPTLVDRLCGYLHKRISLEVYTNG